MQPWQIAEANTLLAAVRHETSVISGPLSEELLALHLEPPTSRTNDRREDDNASIITKATSKITVAPTQHGKARMSQREVSKKELQLAVKHGVRTSQHGGRFKFEYQGVTYITDESKKVCITCWKSLDHAICRNWTTQGGCHWGDKCRFAHPSTTNFTPTLSPVAEKLLEETRIKAEADALAKQNVQSEATDKTGGLHFTTAKGDCQPKGHFKKVKFKELESERAAASREQLEDNLYQRGLSKVTNAGVRHYFWDSYG